MAVAGGSESIRGKGGGMRCVLNSCEGELHLEAELIKFVPTQIDEAQASFPLSHINSITKATSMDGATDAIGIRMHDSADYTFCELNERDTVLQELLTLWETALRRDAATAQRAKSESSSDGLVHPDAQQCSLATCAASPSAAGASAQSCSARNLTSPTRADSSATAEQGGEDVSSTPEELACLHRALQRTLAASAHVVPPLTEAHGEVELLCSALEALLSSGFKTRQFMLFTVHPFAFVETASALGEASAAAVRRAAAVGSNDAARLRAWIYLHLNKRTLADELAALLADEASVKVMYHASAPLVSAEWREMASELLRPLNSIAFRLGASGGLADSASLADGGGGSARDESREHAYAHGCAGSSYGCNGAADSLSGCSFGAEARADPCGARAAVACAAQPCLTAVDDGKWSVAVSKGPTVPPRCAGAAHGGAALRGKRLAPIYAPSRAPPDERAAAAAGVRLDASPTQRTHAPIGFGSGDSHEDSRSRDGSAIAGSAIAGVSLSADASDESEPEEWVPDSVVQAPPHASLRRAAASADAADGAAACGGDAEARAAFGSALGDAGGGEGGGGGVGGGVDGGVGDCGGVGGGCAIGVGGAMSWEEGLLQALNDAEGDGAATVGISCEADAGPREASLCAARGGTSHGCEIKAMQEGADASHRGGARATDGGGGDGHSGVDACAGVRGPTASPSPNGTEDIRDEQGLDSEAARLGAGAVVDKADADADAYAPSTACADASTAAAAAICASSAAAFDPADDNPAVPAPTSPERGRAYADDACAQDAAAGRLQSGNHSAAADGRASVARVSLSARRSIRETSQPSLTSDEEWATAEEASSGASGNGGDDSGDGLEASTRSFTGSRTASPKEGRLPGAARASCCGEAATATSTLEGAEASAHSASHATAESADAAAAQTSGVMAASSSAGAGSVAADGGNADERASPFCGVRFGAGDGSGGDAVVAAARVASASLVSAAAATAIGKSSEREAHGAILQALHSDYFVDGSDGRLTEAARTHQLEGRGKMLVRRMHVANAEMREGEKKLHAVYLMKCRVGPFECITYRRFSEFLQLHRSLKAASPAIKMPASAKKLKECTRQLQPLKHTEERIRLLQNYCIDLCGVVELAQSPILIEFCWPSCERGDGLLIAPDGSEAYMT